MINSKTLILLFRRDLSMSKANASLFRAASVLHDVKIIDMQARYPAGTVDMICDAEAEVQILLGAERLVLQFPLQWYSTPALLKAWQDAVLTRMYYIRAETEGYLLAGTALIVAVTVGNTSEAYSRTGANYFTIDEILTPLKATAHRCGLLWHKPYLVFKADKLDATSLDAAGSGYVRALEDFAALDTAVDALEGA